MGVKEKLFDFYINSSIHVALAVVSLSLVTWLHFKIRVREDLLFFIFFGTISGYNFVKYAGIAGLHHRSLTKRLKNIQVFSFMCFLGLLISSWHVGVDVLLWSAFFGIFTLLYALPVLSKKRNLRSVSGIKIFIIAIVWAGVTVVLPLVPFQNVILNAVVLELLQRFLLVLVWILPFEIRDLKYDLEQLGTLPQRIGVTRTKIFGFALQVLVVGLEFFKQTASLASFFAIGAMSILSGFLLWKAKEHQSPHYSAFWVEGIPVMWLLFLLFFGSF